METFADLYRMFRGPRCPIGREEWEWIDERWRWLAGQFGVEVARRPPLTPDSELLPDAWRGDEDDGIELLTRLCGFMGIEASRLDVEYYDSDGQPVLDSLPTHERSYSGPAGLFQAGPAGRYKLSLDTRGLDDPQGLVATICHELAHVHLIGDGRLDPDAPDHEETTDLLTTYFGAGVFSANTAVRFAQWSDIDAGMHGWEARRLGYLSEGQHGYALARYARSREERRPSWRRYLHANIRHLFDDAEHFLEHSSAR